MIFFHAIVLNRRSILSISRELRNSLFILIKRTQLSRKFWFWFDLYKVPILIILVRLKNIPMCFFDVMSLEFTIFSSGRNEQINSTAYKSSPNESSLKHDKNLINHKKHIATCYKTKQLSAAQWRYCQILRKTCNFLLKSSNSSSKCWIDWILN